VYIENSRRLCLDKEHTKNMLRFYCRCELIMKSSCFLLVQKTYDKFFIKNTFGLNNVYFKHKNIVDRISTIVYKGDLGKLKSLCFINFHKMVVNTVFL